MLFAKRTAAAAVAALLAGGIIAGCGSSHETSIPISARLVGAIGSSPGQIILSQLGKDHIGLQTARAQAVPVPPPVVTTKVVAGVKHTTSTPAPRPSASVIVPYSALVYDPTGKHVRIHAALTADVCRGARDGRQDRRGRGLPGQRAKGRRRDRDRRRGGAVRRSDRRAGADVSPTSFRGAAAGG